MMMIMIIATMMTNIIINNDNNLYSKRMQKIKSQCHNPKIRWAKNKLYIKSNTF